MATEQQPSTSSLFAHPAFARFWLARVCTIVAFQMQVVAVGWQMYALTQNPMDLGWVGLMQFLPVFFLMLVVGQVADRYDRRRIAACCQAAMGMVTLILCFTSAQHVLEREGIFILVMLMGCAKAFESPSMSALLPALVPELLLPRAIGLSSSAMQAAFIVGPALGGMIYVFGAAVVYASSSVLFVCAMLSLLSIKKTTQVPRKDKVDLETLLAGIHFIRRKPVVLGALSLDLFAVLFGGATALLPIYARDILHSGPWGLGALRACPAVGALLMSLYLARWPVERNTGKVMMIAVAIFGCATITFGISTSIYLSLGSLLLLGASDMISVVIRSSLVQLETPDAMRGRVSAVNFLFIGTSNQLGEFESGLTAHWWGAKLAVVAGGLGTISVVILWNYLFPALGQRDRLATAENEHVL
jgi:MFS family permease